MCVLTKQISQTIGNEKFFVSTLPHLCEAKLISFGIIYCSYQHFFLSIYFVHSFQGQPGVFNFKGRRNFPLLIWSYTLKCQCINLIGINFISPTLQVARLGKFRSIISLCKITNQMWCDHTFKKRSKVMKRDGRGRRGLDKTRSIAGKQYRVSLHKIGRFLKPSANYRIYIPQMADDGYIGEDWKRCFLKNHESADRICECQSSKHGYFN